MNLKCRTLSDHQKGWLPLKKKENNFKTRVEICSIALLFGIFIIGLGMMLYSVSLSNMEGAAFMKHGCVISCMALSMATSVTLNFAEYNDGAYGFGFIFLALAFGYLTTMKIMAGAYSLLNIASGASLILGVVLVLKELANEAFSSRINGNK